MDLEEPDPPVAGSLFDRVRNALEVAAYEANQRITLVSLLCAILVLTVFWYAYLLRRRV